jgi:hypothetical protein
MCIQLNLEKYVGVKKSVVKDVGSYWGKQNCITDLKDMRRRKRSNFGF